MPIQMNFVQYVAGGGVRYHTHDNYQIDRCEKCGFIYTKQIPSNDFLKQYYDAQYTANSSNGVFVPKKTIGIKHQLLAKLLKFLVRDDAQKSTKQLLEIGCSQGELLSKFKSDDTWHATGLDYGSAAIHYARSKGLDGYVSDVESMNFPAEKFDAVVALHVMEHVQNLNAFIQEVHRVTKQGGYFFAVMPSMSHYKPKLAGAKWKYWGPPAHLWFFTNHSLTLFLEKNGFEVKHCSSFYHRAHVRVLAKKK
jgi:ubiquinone/menaquinone biosynthesis C-methylase UbiE